MSTIMISFSRFFSVSEGVENDNLQHTTIKCLVSQSANASFSTIGIIARV